MQNLSPTQWTKTWADISSPITGVVPRKYLSDIGPNAAAIFVKDWRVYQSGASGAPLKVAQSDLVSMFVQDNPSYLVAPPFDPSINVPGDAPIS